MRAVVAPQSLSATRQSLPHIPYLDQPIPIFGSWSTKFQICGACLLTEIATARTIWGPLEFERLIPKDVIMWKKLVACAALALISLTAQAADTFKVDLSVSRNGILVGQPSIQVTADRNADLTITPPGSSAENAIRVVMSVAPAADKGVVGIHLMVFDRVNGEWTLRAEPTMKAKLGSDVQLNVGTKGLARVASPIDLTVKVAAGTPVAAAGSAWAEGPAMDFAAAPLTCNCCTAGNVQCCNVVSCCDNVSGNCCSPPCHRVEADRNLTTITADRPRRANTPIWRADMASGDSWVAARQIGFGFRGTNTGVAWHRTWTV